MAVSVKFHVFDPVNLEENILKESLLEDPTSIDFANETVMKISNSTFFEGSQVDGCGKNCFFISIFIFLCLPIMHF